MQTSIAVQALSLMGAALLLAAYVGHQMKWMDARRPAYNALNAAGAALLCYVALSPLVLGFAILEGVWALVSLHGLYRAARWQA